MALKILNSVTQPNNYLIDENAWGGIPFMLRLRQDLAGILVHAFMKCHITALTSIFMMELCNKRASKKSSSYLRKVALLTSLHH